MHASGVQVPRQSRMLRCSEETFRDHISAICETDTWSRSFNPCPAVLPTGLGTDTPFTDQPSNPRSNERHLPTPFCGVRCGAPCFVSRDTYSRPCVQSGTTSNASCAFFVSRVFSALHFDSGRDYSTGSYSTMDTYDICVPNNNAIHTLMALLRTQITATPSWNNARPP